MAIPYPHIDPDIVRFGPIALRWYGVAYMAGLILGWRYMRWLVSKSPHAMTAQQVDDFLVWATFGVVLGGRLGYVLFYKPNEYLADPIEIVQVWKGGMSFHGGALGVIVAIAIFTWRSKLSFFKVGDVVCAAVPIGLFFGRLANYNNGELYGRPAPSWLPWAMLFPEGDQPSVPRHPSQLYEAGLEGIVLFVLLHLLWRSEAIRTRPGTVAGSFLAGYGVARIIAEFFREPDSFLGPVIGQATMGQVLSVPLVVAGLAMVVWPRPRPA